MSRKSFATYLPSSSSSAKKRKLSGRRSSRLGRGQFPMTEALEDRLALSTMSVVNLDDSGPGSLRQAIEDANNSVGIPDVIEFAPGLNGTISLTSGELDITDDLAINGPGMGDLTVSGSGLSRVFDVSDTNLAINQLAITDGFTTSDLLNPASFGTAGGAGIRATNSTVSLEQVVLEDNRVVDSVFAAGAAIQARGLSSVSLEHVAVRNNAAHGLFFAIGGAVQSDQGSTLEIKHSTFDGNRAANHALSPFTVGGGAIGISGGGHATISYTQFADNQVDGGSARGLGGAIHNTFGSTLVINSSGFHDNSAIGGTAGGGAIANNSGSSSIIANSQLIRNRVVAAGEAQGGAIWNEAGGTVKIDQSSIVNNQAIGTDAFGGGIYSVGNAVVTMTTTNVNANRAKGSAGEGIGGGVYTDDSTFNVDSLSNIHGNKASTSHDDVFGDLTLLDDLLAPI